MKHPFISLATLSFDTLFCPTMLCHVLYPVSNVLYPSLPCTFLYHPIDTYSNTFEVPSPLCCANLPLFKLIFLLSRNLGIPGLTNPTVLGALFSLTATGLYSSYLIPILLRVTVSRESFQPAEFNLGKYSIPMGWISVLWCLFMIIVLCLPQDTPITQNNMNYSPIALGFVLVGAWFSWMVSARNWFKGTY